MSVRHFPSLLVFCFVSVLSLVPLHPVSGESGIQVSLESPESIDVSRLRELQSQKSSFLLLDVRQPEEYKEGHIDGSVLLPLGELPARKAELPKDKKIVVYCRSGRRSAQAVSFLRAQGFSNVLDLSGGYRAWAETDKAGSMKHTVCSVVGGCTGG